MARFDFHGDVAHVQLNELSQRYEFPDFVKSAQADDVTSLPERKGSYAETIHRHFPCHTKAATWLSCLYFTENGHNLAPDIRARAAGHLLKFAERWGISSDYATIRRRHDELSVPGESQLPDSAFAIVKASADGRLVRQYPLRNAREVKAAAAWFEANLPAMREVYPFADRQIIATRIMDKAAEFGADLGDHRDTLEKTAGLGTGTAAALADAFKQRAYLAVGKLPLEKIAHLEAAANQLRTRPAFFNDPGLRADLVTTLETIDRMLGVKYAGTFMPPEDAAFGLTRSRLSALHDSAVELSNGSVFTVHQLQKVALETLADVFGKELAETVRRGHRVNTTKLAHVASTMSYADAQAFEDILLSVGESPIKAAGWSLGISNEVAAAVAAAALPVAPCGL